MEAVKAKKRTRFTAFGANDLEGLEIKIERFLENTEASIVSSSMSEGTDPLWGYGWTVAIFYKFPEDL
jgi:hypothetical protein